MLSNDEIEQRLTDLAARVASLEAALQKSVAGSGSGFGSEPSVSAAPPPPSLSTPISAGARAPTLESRIGAQLLNRVGIAAVLIGMAWFLKLAFDRDWIGPSIRILIGLVCAVALVAWSERFRRRGFPAFSYSLKALGTSIAYLALWATFSMFHLAPWWLVFAAMAAVTVANAILAHRQNSEVLAIYALTGGLATPVLLSVGHREPLFLFAYLTLLNGGALRLLARHPWIRLAWSALAGTGGYYIGWSLSNVDSSLVPITAGFLAVLFVLFAAMPFLLMQTARSLSSLSVAFPVANAGATWVALLLLFSPLGWPNGRAWATFVLALACLALVRVGAALRRSHLGLAVFFVTATVPLAFHGYAVNFCWLGEALLLVVLARVAGGEAIRLFATAVLTLAAIALIFDWFAGRAHALAVVTNAHFAASMAGAVVFATVIALSLGHPAPKRISFGDWVYIASFSSVAFGLIVLLALCLEIHHYWFCGAGFLQDYCGAYGQLERRTITARLSYSACCMVYGALLMIAGFMRRTAFLRWQALALFAFSILLVFLSGISQQGQGYRVLSFLGLGVLLLVVSFAYQRDWLRLRG
jgi:uncharacterized membrane protein